MSHRLYLADLDVDGSVPIGSHRVLDRDQSHYLLRVLRLKAGAEICCFNGRGRESKREKRFGKRPVGPLPVQAGPRYEVC